MQERPSNFAILVFALGQFGWSLAVYSVANLLVYFYLPPDEEGSAIFQQFISQESIILGLTLIGLITFGGRLLDALIDPLIAGFSDKRKSKMGKRKSLMAFSAVPFGLLSLLVFYPISESSLSVNTIFLVGAISCFYFFYTLYVIPYNALISELGHHPDDRLKISTAISVTFALGLMLGSQVYVFQAMLESSYSSLAAFQIVLACFALFSIILMLMPVFFLDENRFAKQEEQTIDTWHSLRIVFKDVNFRYFLISDAFYWLALTFIQLGTIYFITVLFQYDKESASAFLMFSFLLSISIYFFVYKLTPIIGKKELLIAGFVIFACTFLMVYFIPYIPISLNVMYYIIIVLAAFPLAVFGILPNVIIADAVNYKEKQTGESQAGMYFGVRNFLSKVGISLANLIFPSLLLFGYTVDNNQGVRLCSLAAFGFCLIGMLFLLKYKDLK